ncbi:MAG: hypothetical protein ACTHLU_10950 [Novosphingobium sp.]
MIGLLFIGFGIPIGIIGYIAYIAFIRKRHAFGALVDDDEAVILSVHGEAIDDRYKNWVEFENFISNLQWELGIIGEVRDVNISADVAIISIFGESAEEIYAQLKKVLRHTSFSKNASVVLRYGPLGSKERRTHMAN